MAHQRVSLLNANLIIRAQIIRPHLYWNGWSLIMPPDRIQLAYSNRLVVLFSGLTASSDNVNSIRESQNTKIPNPLWLYKSHWIHASGYRVLSIGNPLAPSQRPVLISNKRILGGCILFCMIGKSFWFWWWLHLGFRVLSRCWCRCTFIGERMLIRDVAVVGCLVLWMAGWRQPTTLWLRIVDEKLTGTGQAAVWLRANIMSVLSEMPMSRVWEGSAPALVWF